jgi:5'-nucleotidase (lipoprotein e(P4) family)
MAGRAPDDDILSPSILPEPIVVKLASLLVLSTLVALPARAQQATQGLETKYVRDSEEYATLARMVYRSATQAVESAARQSPARWAVVLDIDETTLDNSLFQLESLAYGVPYSEAAWARWTARRAAGRVPGVDDFIASVRRLGGHVAWITNRNAAAAEDTRANLQSAGLWNDDDRLCVFADTSYTKNVRRAEVVSGAGRCAWQGQRMGVLAYLGDQMGDFPAAGESDPDAGRDAAFGVRYFLLPNPMYGTWTGRVTRRAP